jgi:hypothetical protein
MKYSSRWIRAAAGTAVVALAVAGAAGCSESATPGKTTTAPTAATGMGGPASAGPSPSAATTSRPPASASPPLADGRSAVYLTGLDTARNTVTFDLIEFLTGDAAKAEWTKQHPNGPEGPDNGYLIVNNNAKLRTLPVAAGASCVVLASLGSTDTKTITFAALPAAVKKQNKGLPRTPPRLTALPYWLTVRDGAVTKFEEQFLP